MSTLNHFGKLVALLVFLSVSGFHNPRLCLHSRDCPHQVLFSADSDYEEEALPSKKRRGPARVRPIRPTASTEKVQARRVEAQARHNEALKDPTLLSIVKFAERTDIHPATKRAITEVMGLQSMTQIQAKTYAAALAGDSVLGRARTGTGKTLAYLLPALERLLGSDLELYRPGRNIGILIVAPTRELAIQIADQAKYLLSFHNDMDVACIYGGTKIQRDTRILSGKTMPTILVATPGRLLDHLEETRIERRKFSDIIAETRIVVLDEADRLFEGFSKETTSILSFLPRAEKRQTLLFSATVPNKLRGFLKGSMKIDFTEVDCVNDGEVQSETNARVEQTFFVLENMEQYIPILVELLREAMKEDNHKVVVFFPATKIVRFFADFFNVGLKIPVLELHSRMSQSSRNRASSSFREAKRGVLFTSDVSARGKKKYVCMCYTLLLKLNLMLCL
jgi:ATP-dependent RNA helicase MSS116